MAPFVFLILVLALGCSEETSDPLSAKERDIIGSWQLDLSDVDEEIVDVSYRFDRGGDAVNEISGEFLKQLQEMEELGDVDFGDLENIDGGTLTWTGGWSIAPGDSLDVVFERITVELFGRLPIIGKRPIPVHDETLADPIPMRFACAVTANRLTLTGRSPADAVTLDGSIMDAGAVGDAGRVALNLVVDALQSQSGTEPELTLVR